MTVETATAFDIEGFRRAYEQWDMESLLGLYADDVESVRRCEGDGGEHRRGPPSRRRNRHM
jgi:hypothetical protein